MASDVRLRDVAFIAEHSDAFSGVTVETRTVRDYPFGALCAHALGYTGTPSEDQVSKAPSNRDIQLTDDVGKSGIESAYDNLLAGDHGQRVVTVDAQGNVVDVVSETKATRGSDVYLTIKGSVQYAADEALASLIAPGDGVIGTGKGVGGAVVAMDVRDGSIIALSSYPTFDPTNWVGGLSTEANNVYNSDSAHAPLQNRVTAGLYAAASTFKPFTGLAGLEYGFAEGRSWDCTGKWDGFNTGSPQWCWNHNGHGYLDFRGGIVNSCDVVFYEIAKNFFYASKSQGGNLSDTAIQELVQRFDFGKKAGIDIGGEVEGLVPTPEWKATRWRNVPANAPWTGGDYTNMIIGQGDVQVTPIQVAVAYGGIATGKIMKPHLLKEVRNASGQTVVSYEPEVVTEPDIDQRYLEIVRDALRGVVTENEGIASLFAESGIKAAGKTGTAEHTDKGDDAWFGVLCTLRRPEVRGRDRYRAGRRRLGRGGSGGCEGDGGGHGCRRGQQRCVLDGPHRRVVGPSDLKASAPRAQAAPTREARWNNMALPQIDSLKTPDASLSRAASPRRGRLPLINLPFVAIIVLLVGYGLLVCWSSIEGANDTTYSFTRQLLFAAVGAVVMMLFDVAGGLPTVRERGHAAVHLEHRAYLVPAYPRHRHRRRHGRPIVAEARHPGAAGRVREGCDRSSWMRLLWRDTVVVLMTCGNT